MIFASPAFLFAFLPLFLLAYYALPFRWKSPFIMIGSSFFYGWFRADFLVLLYFIIGLSWLCALGIEQKRGTSAARLLLWLGLGVNLCALGYFKYFNFGLESLNAALAALQIAPITGFARVILPAGISFFVFHAISYIVDVWRNDTPPTRNIFDFAAFITLFPHLIAGPVLRYKDLARQFTGRVHTMALFSEGAYRFMAGFCKKILIADTVAPLADAAFALQSPTMADAWVGALAYAIQLFYDFAGYSEMAVGLALMMGFRFIENFRDPYLSQGITEFWRRWHISLSTWLRDYLYIPLGGNRKGHGRTYVNLFLTMFLGGLWHGSSWTFIIWGSWHGALLAIERWRGEKNPDAKKSQAWHAQARRLILTQLAVLMGWVMFRAPHVGDAFTFYKAMLGANGTALSDAFAWQVSGMQAAALALGIFFCAIMPRLSRRHMPVELSKGSYAMQVSPKPVMQGAMILVFLLAVSRMMAMNYSPFLYFQF